MRLRSIVPLTIVAALMVIWLSVRMWFGNEHTVWLASCLIGAWSPIVAAVLFHYVRTFGRAGDSIAIAWLVRALGMHFVLAWMLGFADWLRGPPGQPPAWNTDLGAPLVLISFAPVFAAAVLCLAWLLRTARRLNVPLVRPTIPGERGEVVPFRGVALMADGAANARAPFGPFLVGAAGLALAYGAHEAAFWVLPVCALPLAAFTVRTHRALAPSVVTLVALTLLLQLQAPRMTYDDVVEVAMRWPWISIAAVAFYLLGVEALLRARTHASAVTPVARS